MIFIDQAVSVVYQLMWIAKDYCRQRMVEPEPEKTFAKFKCYRMVDGPSLVIRKLNFIKWVGDAVIWAIYYRWVQRDGGLFWAATACREHRRGEKDYEY
jgi:hypothetical protein